MARRSYEYEANGQVDTVVRTGNSGHGDGDARSNGSCCPRHVDRGGRRYMGHDGGKLVRRYPDNNSFQLSGAGNSNLLTQAVFDYETKDEYSIRVMAAESSGGGLVLTNTFAISVIDDETETLRMYALAEAQVGETLVGVLQSQHGQNTSVTYSVVTDESDVFASIAPGSNELRLDAGPAEGDVGKEYFVQVRVEGDQVHDAQTMWIKVTVVNEATSATIFIFR